MLDIQNLYKQYKGQKVFALHDVSFKIHSGEIYGLLGPNGAGKTTLFSVLSGIVKPNSGTITFQEQNLLSAFNQFKTKIGVVPQDIALYPSLSAVQNLSFIGRMYGMKGAELKDKIHTLLDYFSFDSNRNDPVKNYSGGMKRKVNLVAGILHDPELLLLDEPTAGMDVQSRNKMMIELKRINQEQNLSILYTSHYMEQAEKFCDQVAIINHGKIELTGNPQKIIKDQGAENLESIFLSITEKNTV